MEAVTTLPQSRPLTRADLATMPDDGHRYELIDGTLIVTPAPSYLHQRAAASFVRLLVDAPPGLETLFAPFDVPLSEDTVVQPDVVVIVRQDDLSRPADPELVLAIEVLSPSTRLIDLNLKRARLEQAGVPSYWVFDPLEPMVVAWELQDGVYAEVARVSGHQVWTSTRPWPLTLRPADLVR